MGMNLEESHQYLMKVQTLYLKIYSVIYCTLNHKIRTKKPLNGNISNSEPVTIEDLFDDIFDAPIEESEKASIFTDDEEEESVEGFDPNNATFTMPADNVDDIDVFDTILQDLDEKVKEIEKKENKEKKANKKKEKEKEKEAGKKGYRCIANR